MGAKTQEVLPTGRSAKVERPRPDSTGRGFDFLFGVPVGDLGWFASLLMGTATGFAAFFAATFLGIVGIMVYNSSGHRQLDYAYSYTRLGLPAGVLVLAIALGYLGTLWVRRHLGRR